MIFSLLINSLITSDIVLSDLALFLNSNKIDASLGVFSDTPYIVNINIYSSLILFEYVL